VIIRAAKAHLVELTFLGRKREPWIKRQKKPSVAYFGRSLANCGWEKTDPEMLRPFSWKYSEPADGELKMRYLGWLEEEVGGKEGEQDGIAGG
jgi:hypothetical protein